MPTDWVFYYLTRPLGLSAIGAAIVLPFFIWRLMLGRSFRSFGIWPLVAGYASALLGLTLLNFLSSYVEFTSRVDKGVLQESVRWSIVPGWTLYTVVLSLVFVLPLLGLLGVPITAFLLRIGRLSYRNMSALLFFFWLLLTTVLWSIPPNEWASTHRLQFLRAILFEFVPGLLLVAAPFLGAVFLTVRLRRGART